MDGMEHTAHSAETKRWKGSPPERNFCWLIFMKANMWHSEIASAIYQNILFSQKVLEDWNVYLYKYVKWKAHILDLLSPLILTLWTKTFPFHIFSLISPHRSAQFLIREKTFLTNSSLITSQQHLGNFLFFLWSELTVVHNSEKKNKKELTFDYLLYRPYLHLNESFHIPNPVLCSALNFSNYSANFVASINLKKCFLGKALGIVLMYVALERLKMWWQWLQLSTKLILFKECRVGQFKVEISRNELSPSSSQIYTHIHMFMSHIYQRVNINYSMEGKEP